ncbi:FeoA family protein [Algivirga pacifica]|uniref:Ferrous iron transporter FeoA-like domain-containing protein n=1 Tax=Algivirga pacifica TaxID=1162670 RepID=A0ABP9DPR0_9BACT
MVNNDIKNITDLKIGQEGVIKAFSSEYLTPKMLEMGILPGSKVKVVNKTLFNGPLYLNIQGQNIALRHSEAKKIILR